MRNFAPRCSFLLAALLLAALLSACDTSILPTPPPTSTIAPTLEASPTPGPTYTPTPQPLGSSQNPLIMGLVLPAADRDAANAAEALAAQLSKSTGYSIQSVVSPDYATLIKAMDQGKTHFAWLPPLSYLYAKQEGVAEVGLLANHFGVYSYASQFLANADSNFTVYFDVQKRQSTADAANALRQFAGKRPCWVDPTSASGFVVPSGLLKSESIETLPPVMAQDHISVIRSLYAKGICDFGVTYGGSGDPRTASSLQSELPNVLSKVIIIWQTDSVIPNLNVSFASNLPQSVKARLMDALISQSQTKEGKAGLTAANKYDIGGLKLIDDAFYQPLRALVAASGVDLDTLVGK